MRTVGSRCASAKRKSKEINARLLAENGTDEHSSMVGGGAFAPTTLTKPASSIPWATSNFAVSAPTAVRLDGNFVRRHFPPAVTDRTFFDDKLPGFSLRVRKAGGIGSWCVIISRRGKQVRVTLGRADVMSAVDARAAARKAIAATTLDGLPKPPPKPSRVTLESYADEFLRDYGRHWKPATRKTSGEILGRELLPAFGGCAVADIARTDVNRWRDSLAGPREAVFNRAVPVLSVMLQYAEQLGYRRKGGNPCRGIARYKRQTPRTLPVARRVPIARPRARRGGGRASQ